MVQLIVFIIFSISTLALGFMLYRKIPVLSELPQNGSMGITKPKAFVEIEKKVKDFYFHFFEKQMLLHKLLSFVKVMTLKVESKTDTLLHGVRKKAQELDKKTKKK